MSTRSRIGIIRSKPDGKPPFVESVYCHFDGYPEGVGATLLEHWTDEAKINQLIELGGLSVLGSEIGEQHEFDHHAGTWVNGKYVENPTKDWCLFYGRDRGDEGMASAVHTIADWPDSGQECEYVYDPEEGTWHVRSTFGNPFGWNTVAEWEGWVSIPEAIEAEQATRAAS